MDTIASFDFEFKAAMSAKKDEPEVGEDDVRTVAGGFVTGELREVEMGGWPPEVAIGPRPEVEMESRPEPERRLGARSEPNGLNGGTF